MKRCRPQNLTPDYFSNPEVLYPQLQYVSVVLAKKQFYHTSFKIYTVSVVFRFLATVAMCTSRIVIHPTGFEYKPIEYVGTLLLLLLRVPGLAYGKPTRTIAKR
jgi:hypothetical protein